MLLLLHPSYCGGMGVVNATWSAVGGRWTCPGACGTRGSRVGGPVGQPVRPWLSGPPPPRACDNAASVRLDRLMDKKIVGRVLRSNPVTARALTEYRVRRLRSRPQFEDLRLGMAAAVEGTVAIDVGASVGNYALGLSK